MNADGPSDVDTFLEELGQAPVPAGMAHQVMQGVRELPRPARRGRGRTALALAASVGVVALAVGAFIVGSRPQFGPSPSPSRATPGPSAVASVAPTTAPPTTVPPITGSWQLTLPMFQERSFRLEVADQSGTLINARVANEWPAGLGTVEDPFELYVEPVEGKPNEVFVGWAVLVCDYRGRLLLDETGTSLSLQLAPSPGCELAPIAQGVILEFAVETDATALTGRRSREALVDLDAFMPSAIAFASRSVGWVGGTNAEGDALVLHTKNGGMTWAASGLGPGHVAEIAAIDAEHGFATLECAEHEFDCRSGTFRWDEDFGGWGGSSFDRFVAMDFAGEHGVAVALPPEDQAPIVPSLRLNDDGGNTDWPRLDDPCPAEMQLAQAERTSSLDLVVLCLAEGGTGGTFKTLLASADRGASWAERAGTRTRTLPVSGSPYGFDLAADGSGWMWGSRMPLLLTTDGGASWAELDVADGDVRIVNDASYLGDGAGFVIVHDPDRQEILLLWTRDGRTWDELRAWPRR